VPIAEVAQAARVALESIQANLLEQARTFLREHTLAASERDEFLRLLRERAGMIDIPWCERPECEAFVKSETSATSRNLRPLEAGSMRCVACGEPARVRAYFAQAY
jgi:prolyl-tRNA synthetase